ncbi:MAG: homoserine kinase, partial [Acidobacteriota bacterium]
MRTGRRLRVRVPATSANLGCGFDCAALALSLYLDTEISPRNDKKITVRYSGPTPDRVPQDGSKLIAQVIQDELTRQGKSQGFDLTIENQIPIGVGLGSSASAIVAGLALSSRLAGREIEESELVRRAVAREGHPDNVAAAWHGGFVLAVSREEGIFTRSVPIPENLQLVLVIPDRVLPTEEARRILPDKLTRADAVHNLQRATALAAEFFSGKPQLESFLFDDRWHQPYR